MSKKGLLLPVIAVFCAMLLVGGAVYALHDCGKCGEKAAAGKGKVSDVMVIKSKVFEKHKKPVINFNHKRHNVNYKIECNDCHHIYKDGKNTWTKDQDTKKCGACHNKPGKAPKKGKPGEKIMYLMEAFHQNCIGCHKKLKKEHKDKNLPTACPKCHVKAKK